MKITAISDLHGYLPKINPTDLLIIGGDICPDFMYDRTRQTSWLNNQFREWLENLSAKNIVAVAGNHDFCFQSLKHLMPDDLPWKYLENDVIEVEGLKIYGTPYILPIWGVFERSEEELEAIYKLIPDDVNVIISHGPAYQYRDKCTSGDQVGSYALRNMIHRIKPILTVCGHIHESYGVEHYEDCIIANASLLDDLYEIKNLPLEFDIDLNCLK